MQNIRISSCFIAIMVLASPAVSAPQGKVAPTAKAPTSNAKLSDALTFMAFGAPYGRFKATTTTDTIMVDNGVFHYTVQAPNYDAFKVHNPENKSYILTTVTQYAAQWAPPIKYPPFKKNRHGKNSRPGMHSLLL